VKCPGIREIFWYNSEKLFNSHKLVDKMPKKEVRKTDRKEALILLSVVALIAIASSSMLTVYATDNGENSSYARWFNGMKLGIGGRSGRRCGGRPYGFIEVSEEYEANVISIAENDLDVQNLINEGYNVTGVRPIITTKIDAQGNVTTKATNAIIMLEKDTTSRASVWVNLEEGKVTRIVILTMTVIEKS